MSRALLGRGGGRTPDPFNDEFDLGNRGWTLAGGTPPTIASGKLHMPSGSTAHRARIPAMPFTMTAFCSSLVFDDINSVYAGAGPNIAEASPAGSPGPVWWGPDWDVDILGKICIYDGRWSDFTHQTGHLHAKILETSGLTLQVPFYLQILVHSATNMDAYYSTDNVTYTVYCTGVNPTLTPGAVMFMSFGATTEWDWVRFRDGASSGPA